MERLRLNYDNTNLFSVGADGLLCIFDVIDKNPSTSRTEPALRPSEEILTENTEMEGYITEKEGLLQDFKNLQESHENGVEK